MKDAGQLGRWLCMLAAGYALAGSAAQYSIPADTVLYYPFDTPETAMESFGTDRSRLSADTGEVRFLTDGRHAGCLFFDGDAVLSLPGVPAALPTGDAPYTVAAWIRVHADCPPTGGWISYGDKATGCGNSFRLAQMDRVHNYWNARDLTASMPDVGDGAWHHVVGTWDGRVRRLYYDGQEVASDEKRPEIGRGLFMIGKTMHDRPFMGAVDEVLVASRAFTPTEIASLCADGIARSGVRALVAKDSEAVFAGDVFLQPEMRPVAVKASAAEKEGWTITFSFNADGLDCGTRLFSIPGVMRAEFRLAGVSQSKRDLDDRFGNYLNFPTADGTFPVIEATIPGQSTIGVPLGCLKKPSGAHVVTICRGVDANWFMTVDEGYDEDGLRAKEWRWPVDAKAAVVSDRVKELVVRTPAIPRAVLPDSRPIERPIQFWTPDGHNTWVGDVVVGVYRGRFHVFYLLDRRHHASKGGTGGHYFAHISSPDLAHWFEHPPAVTIDEWWQTLGTGTPFVYDGKFCIAYGLHTTRFMKAEETTEPFLKEYFRKHGETGVFDFGSIPGYPLGGAYAESEDGVHFTRVNKLIHSAQNPTVYNRLDGRLGFVNSYGGIHGMYVSDDKPWGWKLEDDKIPIRGDCPCAFEWNGHHYLIQGFTKMAYNPDGKPGHWTNWTQTGDDVYDGLCVPMVAPWKGNRRIIAGWIAHPLGWGGWLAFHELVQYPDGKLGSKWLDEIPAPGDVFTFEGRPGECLARRFKGGADILEFSVDAANARAQFANVRADGSVPRMNTNAERERAGSNEAMRKLNGPPGSADEYAIERIRGLDRPYKVRLCVYYDRKSNVTLFDAEIAGQRTMVCRRPGRFSPVEKEYNTGNRPFVRN